MRLRRIALGLVLSLSATWTWASNKPVIRAVTPVPGEYLVRLNDTVTAWQNIGRKLVQNHGGVGLDSLPDIRTLFVRMTDAQAEALNREPFIRSVEENAILSVAVTNPQTGLNTPPSGSGLATLWGLDRLDQSSPSSQRLDGSYGWCSSGTGARIYLIDTGIYGSHAEFEGRVDSLPELATYLTGLNPSQGLGAQCWSQQDFRAAASHGTATASVAGGTNLGVAKGATLVDARGANCGGGFTSYRVTKIVDWICRLGPRATPGRMIINMSFSGLYHQGDPDDAALQSQINEAVDRYNIPVVCAAGNAGGNEFWYSPGNAARAITVGGLNKDSDTRWSFSNYGYTTSFYAPAQYVEAASTVVKDLFPSLTRDQYRSELSDCTGSYPNDTCTSGTSFAAPHMSGVIARYLERHPGSTRDQIVSALSSLSAANSGARVTEPGGGTQPVLVVGQCP
jgi:subtilisin family serine protease